MSAIKMSPAVGTCAIQLHMHDRARVAIRGLSRTTISPNPNWLPVGSDSLLLEVEHREVLLPRVPVGHFVFRSDCTFDGPGGSAWSVAADTEYALSSV